VCLVEPPFAGRLSGFTLLFEALIIAVCREMTFAAVSRLFGISEYQAKEICHSYVEGALAKADHSAVKNLAMDETARAKGHDYVFIAADADARRVLHVGEGKDAAAVAAFAADFAARQGKAEQIDAVSIDMSPAFIKGVNEHFPEAVITFDKFHVIAHASKAVDETRRKEQRANGGLKGMRWMLLKDRDSLSDDETDELDALIADVAVSRTARAWIYREQLREILQRKQPNIVRAALRHWITCVNRSKVDAMKKVAKMVGAHLEGIVAWARTRITNGFLEALTGVFQAAKRKARGFRSLRTIRTVIFMLAGKLDFSLLNPHIQRVPT
jgi:transposase